MFRFRQHIAFLLFTLFVVIKTVGLHSLEHFNEETDEDCEVCEYVITINKTPFSVTDFKVAKIFIKHNFTTKLFSKYHYVFVENTIQNTLFGRPPPIT